MMASHMATAQFDNSAHFFAGISAARLVEAAWPVNWIRCIFALVGPMLTDSWDLGANHTWGCLSSGSDSHLDDSVHGCKACRAATVYNLLQATSTRG